jgi:hypothetical protein
MADVHRELLHPPIFKFMPGKYVDAFLAGSIKIGTSEEYRIPDGLDDGRADKSELVRNWRPGARKIKMSADHPFIQTLHGGDPPWKGEVGRKDPILVFDEETVLAMHSNGYIFSASKEYTPELAAKMAEKFSADACVSISDVRGFMEIVSKHESLAGRPSHLGKVDYVATNEFAEFGQTDPFKKHKAFRWQEEFRIVWAGEQPKSALYIDVPDIKPLLFRVR